MTAPRARLVDEPGRAAASQMPLTGSDAAASTKTPKPISSVGEALAEAAGEPRRAVAVAGQLPGDRARDAAAVERERGHHVEHEQERVDRSPASPAARARASCVVARTPRRRRSRRRATAAALAPKHRATITERHERARDRDAELLAGRCRCRASSSRRRRRTTGRCRRSRCRRAGRRARGRARAGRATRRTAARRSDGDEERRRVGLVEDVAEVARQPVDHQEQDEEPARARADADAEDARELDRAWPNTAPMVAGRWMRTAAIVAVCPGLVPDGRARRRGAAVVDGRPADGLRARRGHAGAGRRKVRRSLRAVDDWRPGRRRRVRARRRCAAPARGDGRGVWLSRAHGRALPGAARSGFRAHVRAVGARGRSRPGWWR